MSTREALQFDIKYSLNSSIFIFNTLFLKWCGRGMAILEKLLLIASSCRKIAFCMFLLNKSAKTKNLPGQYATLRDLTVIVSPQARQQHRAIFPLKICLLLRLVLRRRYGQFYNGKISSCCARPLALLLRPQLF